MHTTSFDGDIHFVHNGDFSGDVTVVVPAATSDLTLSHRDHTASIKVPFEAIEGLVAYKVQGELISKLEQAGDIQTIIDALGIKTSEMQELQTLEMLRKEQARKSFIQWIVSMDDSPLNTQRSRITLQDIIEEAKKLL